MAFHAKRFLSLSQVLTFDRTDLESLEIWNESDHKTILDSLKCIQFELNFQNGFLV
jgi:hypothetical protein